MSPLHLDKRPQTRDTLINSASITLWSHGWVDQPNGRGTIDIIQSCLVTIFLCSWSSLCLNIGMKDKSRWACVSNKLRWSLFTIFWPEVTVGVAAEQWHSASQCVEDFARLGFTDWTMRHAFFADMGGFMLQAPDFPPFPVDGQQLLYLIRNRYIPFPDVDSATIWEKNKADGFARAVTLMQIVWFTIQCIARAVDNLPLTTLEVTTLAIIFCTVNLFFYWFHKPLDARQPIVIYTKTRIADILVRAGDVASDLYSLTPLDFTGSSPHASTFVAPWWIGIRTVLKGRYLDSYEEARPIQSFTNTRTTPPRGWTALAISWGVATLLIYFGIYLTAWNSHFPSRLEQLLWWVTNVASMSLVVIYLVCFGLGTLVHAWIARTLFGRKSVSLLETAFMFPRWAQLTALLPFYGLYTLVRFYILCEAFIGLRSLPMDAYQSVNWSNLLPHF